MPSRLLVILSLFIAVGFGCANQKESPLTKANPHDKPCADCHALSAHEAESLLKGLVDHVIDVRMSPILGLFEVAVQKQNQKMPIYVDFSRKMVVSGNIIQIATKESLTVERAMDLNRIDVSSVPLEDAVVIGDPAAAKKVIVFDDPECPYCQKLQAEMNRVIAEKKNVAFFIKMLPLKIHPNAREKAKAIVCEKSAQLLEDSLAGRPIPKPSCETDQIEKNEAAAERLGIRSTPTMILPDGRVVSGYRTAQKILEYLGEAQTKTDEKNKSGN